MRPDARDIARMVPMHQLLAAFGVRVRNRKRAEVLRASPGANDQTKQSTVARWYREQVKAAVPDLIAKWEPLVGVRVERIFVQKMKTKWGRCNPGARSIRLNTDLAKKPRVCLEYIVVHEMVHILEPTHSARFVALMDRLMPQWCWYRNELNRAPLTHESWSY